MEGSTQIETVQQLNPRACLWSTPSTLNRRVSGFRVRGRGLRFPASDNRVFGVRIIL